MPTSRASSRACDDVFSQLKADHKRVKRAYREFSKLDVAADPLRCEAVVAEVLPLLRLHTTLEEEFIYPAARSVCGAAAIDVAEIEHAVIEPLMLQLRTMSAEEAKFAAHFAVLCEHLLRHAKHEENVLFRKLRRAKIDWAGLHERLGARRAELSGAVLTGDVLMGPVDVADADLRSGTAARDSSAAAHGDDPAARDDTAALPSDAHGVASQRADGTAPARQRRRRQPATPDNGIVRSDGATSRKI